MARRCAVCGGSVERRRRDVEAHIVITHFRCVNVDEGCRSGGHVVRDRTSDAEIRRVGPIFEGANAKTKK